MFEGFGLDGIFSGVLAALQESLIGILVELFSGLFGGLLSF